MENTLRGGVERFFCFSVSVGKASFFAYFGLSVGFARLK
jgi:hypothetical protein